VCFRVCVAVSNELQAIASHRTVGVGVCLCVWLYLSECVFVCLAVSEWVCVCVRGCI